MTPKHTTQVRELSKTILLIVAAGAVVTAAGSVSGRAAPALCKAFSSYSMYRIRETIRRMRLAGHVKYDMRDANSPIRLTHKGMTRVAKFELRNLLPSKKRGRWDYLWRMVSFDIPERFSYKRHALRRALESAGFYPLQRSVFVSPFPCETQIQKLCYELRVDRFVVCTATSSLGPQEKKVRAHFFERERA